MGRIIGIAALAFSLVGCGAVENKCASGRVINGVCQTESDVDAATQLDAPPIDGAVDAANGVGSPAPCLGGGPVMFFDGNNFVFTGMMTVTAAAWNATGNGTSVLIRLTPTNPQQGSNWNLDFRTTQLGVPMTPGIYEMAERAPFATQGHPGLDISGDGRGCNTVSGRFQVHEYTLTNGTVTSATMTFEHHCEASTTTVLNGCVHFQP